MINVGNPHVEGNDTQFEGDPGDQEDDAEDQHGHVGLTGQQAFGNARDEQRPGRAIDHGHAVEQHAGSQRTQHEVFHARLGRPHRITIHGHHGVKRQRHEFDADIDRDEMARRNHHHHAQRAQQRQHVEFATCQLWPFEIVGARIEQHHAHRHVHQKFHQVTQRIADKHPAEGECALGGKLQAERGKHARADFFDAVRADRQRQQHRHQVGASQERDQRRTDQGGLGQAVSHRALAVLDEQVDDQDQAGHRQHKDLCTGEAQIGQYELHFSERHGGYRL